MTVPVMLITGYLGAGKTTLLRRIAEGSGMKLAIMMNEFGEIAIDARVVEKSNVRIAELAGGCVCCSLSGEFSAAVAEILEAAMPEWIVVETSGVAEPAALAHDIKENMPLVRLDAIVTVVDADAMLRFPSLGHTGREQIELADILLLNKTDLVPNDALPELEDALKRMNGRAAIIRAQQCDIDTDALFGVGHDAPAPAHKIHRIRWAYFDYVSEAEFGHERFIRFMERLPAGIYRAKGFVKTDKGGFLVNHVAGRSTMEPFACGRTELVFIGEKADSCKDGVIEELDSIRI